MITSVCCSRVRKHSLLCLSFPLYDRLVFTVVSEPPDDEEEEDGECADVAYAAVDLTQVRNVNIVRLFNIFSTNCQCIAK